MEKVFRITLPFTNETYEIAKRVLEQQLNASVDQKNAEQAERMAKKLKRLERKKKRAGLS
jgi:hypothetical protein